MDYLFTFFICFCHHVILMWPLFWWPLHTLVGLFGSLHMQTHMALLCCNIVSHSKFSLDHFTIHFTSFSIFSLYSLDISLHLNYFYGVFHHMINGFCHMYSPKYQFSQCSQCSQIKQENWLFFCLKGRNEKFAKNLENKYDHTNYLKLSSEIFLI